MRLADITVGEDYAIKWGSATHRGRVTFAGKGRTYRVHMDRHSYDANGPRVFFQVVQSDGSGVRGTELDVPPGNVLRPWAGQQAMNDAADTAEAMHAARLTAVEAAVIEASGMPNAVVRWVVLAHSGRYSTKNVLVNIETLAAALGVQLPPAPPKADK